MTWSYRCPDCSTETGVHEPDCEYVAVPFATIRRAYVDVLSVLVTTPGGCTFDELASRVTDLVDGETWRSLHVDTLHALKAHRLVTEDDGTIQVTDPADRASEIVPTYDPMQTLYEHGPVDGAKDVAVYSMVSWCEMHDLTWEQTCAFVRRWLEQAGGWERGAWSESSIAELLSGKRHVHTQGLGWLENAKQAKHAIDHSDVEPSLDATADAGEIDPDDLT